MLEDRNCLYCSSCLNITSGSRFWPPEISGHPLTRVCKSPGGIVNLCSCLALTFNDLVHLQDFLRTGKLDRFLPNTVCEVSRSFSKDGQQFLEHQCATTDHDDAFIMTKISLFLGESGDLLLRRKWDLYLKERLPSQAVCEAAMDTYSRSSAYEKEQLLICPHFDLFRDLYNP
ncbi:uncharacterized protein BDV17DRAFT_275398 [Aspergillus undulatus]|uniref:uncharacterized protein n=1 Tax=Aspergillus undulatus TaxID=1810928 RepID=UPI003CCE34CB